MDTLVPASNTNEHPVTITRVADTQWHALEDDLVVGRGHAARRPDGRTFLGIDVWHDTVFDQLVDVMLADLPKPLHTIVDDGDDEAMSHWTRAGFAPGRREWEYLIPTDPRITGLGLVRPPSGVTIVRAGEADEAMLGTLDRAIRDEVEATVGWRTMPAEVLPRPEGVTVLDPSKYAAAEEAGRYVGLVRLAPVVRQPRIGLIAVLADHQRRGIARALLAHVLGSLHQARVGAASAEVDETNVAAMALFEGVGAERVAVNLELVLR